MFDCSAAFRNQSSSKNPINNHNVVPASFVVSLFFYSITVNVWRCFDRLFSSHKDRFPSKTTTHCAGASMKACFCLLDIGCCGATLFCPWCCQLNMKQWDYKWWSSGAFLSQLLTTTNCWCINRTPIISTKECVTLCGIHKKCVASGSSIILHSDILDIEIWAPVFTHFVLLWCFTENIRTCQLKSKVCYKQNTIVLAAILSFTALK